MADNLDALASSTLAPLASLSALATKYGQVRATTDALAAPLSPEDCALQSMTEASPTKWHLAHTSWFFEAFVLKDADSSFSPYDTRFHYLFNSYYEALGPRHPRNHRGLLSRPSLDEIRSYRRFVDTRMGELFASVRRDGDAARLVPIIDLGLEHERQHQELLLTDIQHAFFCNPLAPSYRQFSPPRSAAAPALDFIDHPGGPSFLGHEGEGFCFDNERPRHPVYLQAFQFATRLVTNREYLDFIEDGGYGRPELWVADGYAKRLAEAWTAPLYWHREGPDRVFVFTLTGVQPLDPEAPVSHLSFYEADAYARWAGARLPTEAEWEAIARAIPVEGNFLESGYLVPRVASQASPAQLFGDTWEWTASPYVPYPGFRPLAGALGEYNGKFMCNQMVLRGGSCLTSRAHARATYRNFFYPDARWQMTGIRLARSL